MTALSLIGKGRVMRRLILLLITGCLLFAASIVYAQDETATPAPTDATDALQEIYAIGTQVAERAEESSKEFDQATNFLGIFEAIGLIVALLSGLITVLAVVGGVVGFRGLGAAQSELETARERIEAELAESRRRFDTDMQQRRDELESIRNQLERGAAEQRESAARSNLAQSLLTLGERQYRSQDFAGALDTYRRALELDPNSLITHYRLGYVYTQSGNLEQAQHHLTRALEIENNFAPALAALGYVYRRIGEKMPAGIDRERTLNKAESLLLEGLAISPKLVDDDDESWWGSLGGLYRRRHQVDEAINAYERAGEITPKSSYAFSNLALLYVQKKDKDAMLRTYQRVEQLAWGEVQADVDNYWAYADLLTARLALGKEKEAEEIVTSVLEIAPADSPYVLESLLDTLHRLQTALGETDAAHMGLFIDRIQESVLAKGGTAKSSEST
jgi:tetratricopeptide (TPR) repeat protein